MCPLDSSWAFLIGSKTGRPEGRKQLAVGSYDYYHFMDKETKFLKSSVIASCGLSCKFISFPLTLHTCDAQTKTGKTLMFK